MATFTFAVNAFLFVVELLLLLMLILLLVVSPEAEERTDVLSESSMGFSIPKVSSATAA